MENGRFKKAKNLYNIIFGRRSLEKSWYLDTVSIFCIVRLYLIIEWSIIVD